jgi:folate-binding protein YgfZ
VNLSAYAAAHESAAYRHRHESGILRVTGADRLAWLNGLVTNDIAKGPCYSAWLTPQGRMITDMWVVPRADDLLLEVPAALSAALAARLDGMIFAEDVRVDDASGTIFALELSGPDTPRAIDVVTHSLPSPEALTLRQSSAPVAGVVAYLSRVAFVGAIEALAHTGVAALDDVTAESMRVEAGLPRFLVDMGDDTIPLEAGLDHAISHTKGCYVGQEIIVRIRDRAHGRVARHLVGLAFEGDTVPAAGQPVLLDGRHLGRLTSAVRSIALGSPIGLATLHRDAAGPGTRVTLQDGAAALVTALPFVAKNPT